MTTLQLQLAVMAGIFALVLMMGYRIERLEANVAGLKASTAVLPTATFVGSGLGHCYLTTPPRCDP